MAFNLGVLAVIDSMEPGTFWTPSTPVKDFIISQRGIKFHSPADLVLSPYPSNIPELAIKTRKVCVLNGHHTMIPEFSAYFCSTLYADPELFGRGIISYLDWQDGDLILFGQR